MAIATPGRVSDTPGREPVDGALQRRVLELSDPPAAVADDVMMVLAARHTRLVASLGIPELDPVEPPVAMQQVERPVDARGADQLTGRSQSLGDLLGAETALLAG